MLISKEKMTMTGELAHKEWTVELSTEEGTKLITEELTNLITKEHSPHEHSLLSQLRVQGLKLFHLSNLVISFEDDLGFGLSISVPLSEEIYCYQIHALTENEQKELKHLCFALIPSLYEN